MRVPVRTLATLALCGISLAGCSGGSSTPSTPIRPVVTTPTTTPSTGTSTTSSAFVYDRSFVEKAQFQGPAKFSGLGIDVALKMTDPQGVLAYAQEVSEPRSNLYRHFLGPEEIANRFGATVADQNAAVAYFHSFGLSASTWKQRMLVHVAGTQSQLEAAFHTTFGLYRSPQGESFIAPETQPSLRSGVPVIGSANIVYRTKRYRTQFVPSKGVGSGYSPQQIASVFDYTGAYNAGYTGTNIHVGIIGTGPIVPDTGTKLGDAAAYRELYHVGGSGVVNEIATTSSDKVVNGASGFASPPPVSFSGCNSSQTNPADGEPGSDSPYANCNPEDVEAQLDTEQASSLAKDAQIDFYIAYNPNDGCVNSQNEPIQNSPCPKGAGFPEQGLAEYEEEMQTIIDHDTADVVSGSFGGSEYGSAGSPSPPAPFTSDGSGLDPTQLAMMVTEGMAVFISSGDQGAEGCQGTGPFTTEFVDSLCVEFPASDPDVTAVGGVTTPLNAAGQLAGPITAWGVQTSAGGAGTGGGVSQYFAQPSWQKGLPGILGTKRNVPDLALEADNSTGVAVLLYADKSFGGAELGPVGGTSVAAPEMAAMWALVVQACQNSTACTSAGSGSHPYRLGNPDPMLYTIYQNAATYGKTFLPVDYGDNSLVDFCYYNAPASPCPSPSPTPAPGHTAMPEPAPTASLDPGYTAHAGYNQLTGLGVPFGRALIRAVVGV